MTKELKSETDYKTRSGITVRTYLNRSPTDADETRRTKATYVINTKLGYYWGDGPMVGLYMDNRSLANFKDYPPNPSDLILPNERKSHVQLQLL